MAKRTILFLAAAAASWYPSSSNAADALKFGPAESWVVPQVIPPASDKLKDRPIVVLLHDQQIFLERGKTRTYSELAFKIQKPEGLAAGNLSVEWNPAFDTATVNRLEIRRGDTVIDVLKSGQTFTTMRRESNLDLAMLDGILTANIQPEGLQEGDVIVLATTVEHSDPVLKGHVESVFAPWSDTQIGLAHARLTWPSTLELTFQKSGDLPATQPTSSDGKKVLDLRMKDVEPVISPKGAPVRFRVGRLAEATDFRSWADAAKLMSPLYSDAAVIPSSGTLRDEVENIRKGSPNATVRTEHALQLVQQRIRYVALAMGEGSLVPSTAEVTWSRRFGDCKAKTALLLAILHELGIAAEPVLVNAIAGDAVADRLPMIGAFNHVLVRAHVDGKDYWLDGTRTGDTALDQIEVPKFGWGLPLLENASLVRIIPAPLANPDSEVRIDIDATEGIFTPAKLTISQLFRGDGAVAFNHVYSQLSANQRSEFLHRNAKSHIDSIAGDSSEVVFDELKRELRISTKGTAKLDWQDGWFSVPDSSIAYSPDFDRPSGPQHDAPFATDYPNFEVRMVTIKLPPGFASRESKLPNPVHETLAGMEYERTIGLTGDVLTVRSSERSVAPEIPYKDALAAAARLKALNDEDVYLRVPKDYRASSRDLDAKIAEQPNSAQEFINRGLMFLDYRKYDEAIVDFTEAARLNPKNSWAIANRAIARVWKRDFDGATKDLAAVAILDPNNPVAARARALRAELDGDVDDAVELYSRALEKEPNNSFALLHRGMLLQAQGKLQDALKDFDADVAANPRSDFALAARAIGLVTLQKLDAAEQDIAAALAINPNSPAAYEARGKLAMARGDYGAAVESYTKELAVLPANIEALGERASAYRSLNDNDHALADAAKALAVQSNWPEMHLLRANIYREQGKRDLALAEADALFNDVKAKTLALVTAGRIYGAFGMQQKAMQAFDRALVAKPEAYVYLNRSLVRSKDDLAGRAADLDAALKLDPDNDAALAEKARLLSRSGDYAGALAILDRVKPDPNDHYAAVQRAVVLFKAGRTSEAEQLLKTERAIAKTPADLNNLCWAKATNGILLESALEDCREALKLKDSPQYEDSLGMALLKLGKLDEALVAYDKAVARRTSASSLMGRAFVYARKGDRMHAEADASAARKLYADIDAQFADYGLAFETTSDSRTNP